MTQPKAREEVCEPLSVEWGDMGKVPLYVVSIRKGNTTAVAGCRVRACVREESSSR